MTLQGYFTGTTHNRCCRCLIIKHTASMHIQLNSLKNINLNMQESSIFAKTNTKLALSPSKNLCLDDDFCVPCCFSIFMKCQIVVHMCYQILLFKPRRWGCPHLEIANALSVAMVSGTGKQARFGYKVMRRKKKMRWHGFSTSTIVGLSRTS